MIPAARADFFISDGDRVGKYSDTGVLIDADFITLSGATGVTYGPDGNVYVATPVGVMGASGVYRYNATTGAQVDAGAFVTYNGQPPTPDPRDVIDPQGLRFGPDGNLYVADQSGATSNVHVYDGTGVSLASLSSPSVSDPGGPWLISPTAVAFDNVGRLYALGSDGVLRYDAGTQTFSSFTQPAAFVIGKDLAFGPDGYLYVLDISSSSGVKRFDSTGNIDAGFLIDFSSSTFFAAGLTTGPDGKLYVSGYDAFGPGSGEVRRYNLDGSFDSTFISASGSDPLTFYASYMAFTPEPTSVVLMGIASGLLLKRRVRPAQA